MDKDICIYIQKLLDEKYNYTKDDVIETLYDLKVNGITSIEEAEKAYNHYIAKKMGSMFDDMVELK